MKLKDAPWKKSYDQPRQHNKSGDITLSRKVHLVKAIVFSVVMCGCEKTESESVPCGSAGKEYACNLGDLGWEDPLEKGKATYSSVLA